MGFSARTGTELGPWIGISREELADSYETSEYLTAFVHTAAHEWTHIWNIFTPEGTAAWTAYEERFWTRGSRVVSRNRCEPTNYGRSHNAFEALAKVVALAVSDPSRLNYKCGGPGCSPPRDVGRFRREFVGDYMPFVHSLD
jgi:hypothetical protein